MKNEIGRKLTSLTIMAIMFAGGMAIGVPSFMPEAASDLSSTDGLLTVSTTTLQGVAILEIVVNDPDSSITDSDVAALSASVGGTSYDLTQATNGKWYAYVADASQIKLFDKDSHGFEFGSLCENGLGVSHDTTTLIVGTSTDIYANTLPSRNGTSIVAGGCLDADNMWTTLDDQAGTTSREDMTAAVLQGAPSLSNPDGDEANMGQRGHGINASGYGSWPYIIAVDLNDDNLVEYGTDSINVVYGNTDGESSISLQNRNPADRAEVHLTISDPALNIDPTTADVWLFDLDDNSGAASATTVKFMNNGTYSSGTVSTSNTALTAEELGQHGCVNNCALYSDVETELATGINTVSQVIMTESGANTGVFESFDANGNGQFKIAAGASTDKKTTFNYGGNSVDMIITYADATITLDAGGDWAIGQTATVTITDADANRNPVSAETLNAYDETVVIPTFVVGTGGLTLAGGANAGMDGTNSAHGTSLGGDTTNEISPVVGGGTGGNVYTTNAYNTSDNSERLRIVHGGEDTGMANITSTWLNVTTGHTRADLIGLAGTVVLNYDIRGAADLVSSTDINVFVTDTGHNSTNNSGGVITIVNSGNVKSGSFDLDDDSQWLRADDISARQTFSGSGVGSAFVGVAFQMTHTAGSDLASTADYAISADFCNFDQSNSSLTHNCIYRLEAVETGEDTGVFEGTVEYINLVNSTNTNSYAGAGTHAGNDWEVEDLLGYIKGDALTVVLMDSVSGSDSVRVVYNDTDSFQSANGTKIGAQLETSTHTGDVSLDADTYGAGDIATITIVDADLNQDSAGRDTYTNSSTTFQITVTPSGSSVAQQLVGAAQTIIETGDNTGVFIGTFEVPDKKGSDLDLEFFDSKDASGNTISYYDTATVVSNSGSVSFDRSVYPVPWTANDLSTGDATTSTATQTEAGSVTAWLTISDADETNDTLTTAAGTGAGAVLICNIISNRLSPR